MSVPYYTTLPAPPRRHPLAAANHYGVNQVPGSRHVHLPRVPGSPPPKQHRQHQQPLQPLPQHQQHQQQQQEQKPPASPPLGRQNAKVTPPSPPRIIVDNSRSVEFLRVGLLGEVCASLSCIVCARMAALGCIVLRGRQDLRALGASCQKCNLLLRQNSEVSMQDHKGTFVVLLRLRRRAADIPPCAIVSFVRLL